MPINQERIIEVTKSGRKLYEILKDLKKHAQRAEEQKDPEVDHLYSLVWAIREAQPSPEVMEPILREEAHFKAREKMNISRRNWQRRKDEATNGVRRRFTEQELSERDEGRIFRSMDPEVKAQMLLDQEERRRAQEPAAPIPEPSPVSKLLSLKLPKGKAEGRTMAEILADQAALNTEEEEAIASLTFRSAR